MTESSLLYTGPSSPQKSTCSGQDDYREWSDKLRHAIIFHNADMLAVLDGDPCPDPTSATMV